MMKRYSALSLAMLLLLLGCFTACGSSAAGGDKMKVTLIQILEDGTEETLNIEVTNGANLRDALLEANLIDEENYGALFVETINGHTAAMNDGVLWMPTNENHEQITGFYEEIILQDGQTLYLEYTVAPYFDD